MASPHPVASDLALERSEIAALWSLQGSRETSLADFESGVFGSRAGPGSLLLEPPLCLLRLWPHQAWLRSELPSPPPAAQAFEKAMTDISDGFCEFRLRGAQAFDFLANYLSADLAKLDEGPGCLRCLLGHYVVVLWWNERGSPRLLLERSCAQSFADYIDVLKTRWRPEAP